MRRRHAPRLRAASIPALLAAGALLTAGTAAGSAAWRAGDGGASRPTAASTSTHLPQLQLPSLPTQAAPAPDAVSVSADVTSATATALHRPKHLVDATMLVTAPKRLTHRQVHAIEQLDGVRRTLALSAGDARVDGHRALLLGVDPSTFRPWTPKLTAMSQPLWRSVEQGELTASFDMGHDAQLPLGVTVPVHHHGATTVPVRIGAFASVGMSGVDAVVSARRASDLGLPHGNALVISAPSADAATLRSDVKAIVGRHGHAWLLREVIVVRDAGEFLTRSQIATVLQAAASRVGRPYVWGATGPDAFDCSGLVQWSFAHAGIRMPRVSQQQWFAGPHVPYAAALPGDLLFWHYDPTDPTNIDHVAIYAGNGMMLVAPHTGDFVKYVAVPLTNLAGVVRVDPALAQQIG